MRHHPAAGADSPQDLRNRIAGAPISWGVCEVPDWGYQLDPDTVLAQMRDLGLAATEFGPIGFLADEPEAKAQQLASYDLQAVGGFLVTLLHDQGHDPLPQLDAYIDGCLATGADVVVLAAHTGSDGYDVRPVLDDAGWRTMLANLDRAADHAASRGVTATIHPHIGTMVETEAETQRVIAGSHIGVCVDTGHLAAAGGDPVGITQAHPDRVAHVHLKDVDMGLAAKVVSGEITFGEAVKAGIFCPLGEGDVDIPSMVKALESIGYQGWYVLEQDVMLDGPPEQEGPAANVRQSRDYLLRLAP
jgi:inosose dehydratase